ncbi:MAG: YciI family protein [Acidobacteriota bacterium]|nr:YciI family protein [Acidobacteriota bacterium]
MYGLVIIRYRLCAEKVEEVRGEHRAYLRGLKEKGTLVASGPMDPMSGGVLLVRVPDDNVQAALTALRDGDPFYQKHVASYEVVAWNVVIGQEGLDKL